MLEYIKRRRERDDKRRKMSGGGMPELGSKISLISKADIRYEGRLFTVDPQECTIALANVRSFGTEDRETQYPIAPQSQIYDYILFRGTDIKDIRVVNSMPHPNDPAIMQMQSNGQHLMPAHFPMPAMNPPMGNYGNPFGALGNIGGIGGATGLAPGSFMLNNNNNKPKQQTNIIDLISGNSRSTTPVSLISRKSPSADMGVQVNQNAGHNRDVGHKRQNNQQQNQRGGGGGHRGGGGDGQLQTHQQHLNQRDRRDSGRIDHHQQRDHDNRNHHNNQRNNNQSNQHHLQNNRGSGGWMNRGGNMNHMNMMRNNNNRGRGRMQNQNYFPQGGYRQQGGGNMNKSGRTQKNTIKFEQDYDFEQANNKFEEMRSKLAKLKVGEVDPKTTSTEQVNGESDTKKDDSGNETGAGEHEQEDEDVTVGYDKTKSFFDNISCEAATDRSKAKKNDWRHERKLNSETFGISSTRRGNYRGRGGYYNRNMNHNNGYNRGYRPNNYNNNRGRNNNRIGQSTGLPAKNPNQQQTPQPAPQPAAVVAGAK